jgi:membrane dipeptidase
MLSPNWVKGKTDPSTVSMQDVADHVDHVCQFAGNTRHSGIGSDLDGGYGTEQTPGDMKPICGLLKREDILSSRGYSDADINAIFYDNWIRKLMSRLPTRD